MQVNIFTSDFEEAAVRSFTAVFPNAQIKGRYFHKKKKPKKETQNLQMGHEFII